MSSHFHREHCPLIASTQSLTVQRLQQIREVICSHDLIDVFFNVTVNIRSSGEAAAAAYQLDAAFSVLPGQPFVQPCSKLIG